VNDFRLYSRVAEGSEIDPEVRLSELRLTQKRPPPFVLVPGANGEPLKIFLVGPVAPTFDPILNNTGINVALRSRSLSKREWPNVQEKYRSASIKR
jgi:hypothetical protein